MPTLVLNAYSKEYPLITNPIRAAIYLQSDPYALIATQTKPSPHPTRTWSFPGLPRNNYGFSLDEVLDGVVIRNLALFDVVPGEVDGELIRKDEQIKVGTTIGFDADTNSAIFDGTGGSPDYRGWSIVPSELTGRGILAEGLDYSWDSITGELNLLQLDDQFYLDNVWNIHFNSSSQPAGNSYPTVTDFSIKLVTASYTVLAEDFGGKLICEPTANYMEVAFPAIATVPQGRKLMIEVSGTTRFMSLDGMVAMPNESFSVYRYLTKWRIDSQYGNFSLCGNVFGSDAIPADVVNALFLDGASVSRFTYARLYDYVLQLPVGQVVAYDSWATGNNKYLYSLANISNVFHIPDRRGIFEKNSSGIAGTYENESVGQFTTNFPFPTGDSFTGHQYPPTALGKGLAANSPVTLNLPVTLNAGMQNIPRNYSINRYVYV
jgi:hypothetical protein